MVAGGLGATPTGVDVLRRIVADEPGLSSQQIFDSLLDEERVVYASVRSLERALESHPQFVHRIGGAWYPGPAPDAASGATEPPRRPHSADPHTELERTLREALRGRRLIAEVGFDADLFRMVTDATQHLTVRHGLDRFARLYPFVFMTFLVGHGVYGYERGNYWGTMTVTGMDNAAGPLFRKTCVAHGLEDFDLLVEQDHATRYVGRILAHGGIPKYCLDDFLSLVLKDMHRVGGSADELLAHWRTKKTAFFNIDKPVGRFLLFGGDLAVDLLDRCLSAITDARESDRLPTPDEAGLPPYIVDGLRSHLDDVRSIAPTRARRSEAIRPELVLDPWSPFGPELHLPPVQFDAVAEWRLWSARGVEDVATSSFDTKHVCLPPAKVWHLELRRHGESTREWSFEGFDSTPAIFFSTSGRALSTARSIRGDGVWALAPAEVTFSVVRRSGGGEEARIVQELPDLSGPWSGYVVRHLDLHDVSLLVVTTRDGSTTRVRVQPAASRPRVEEQPVPRVSTTDGRPVFASLPTIVLPALEGMEASRWQIRLTVDGTVLTPNADESLRVELRALDSRAIIGSAHLMVRGPLGIDFRLEFAVVHALQVVVPDRLLFPGDRHSPVTLGAPGVSVEGAPTGERRRLDLPATGSPRAQLTTDDGAIDVLVDVPRLMWAAVRSTPTTLTYTDQVVTAGSHEVLDGAITALGVRTGAHDLPLELHLVIEGRTAQTSDRVRSGGLEGRWTFDLAPFRETLRAAEGAVAEFVLLVGHRPVTVLRLRPSVGVDDVQVSGRIVGDQTFVVVRYHPVAMVRHRVVRFWPLDRPWADAIEHALPDGEDEVHVVRDVEVLPPGEYLVEVEVDDGWTVPARPRADSPNTIVTVLGDRAERIERLRDGDALGILERALLTGHIARPLNEGELAEVAPAALRALRPWVLEPDPRLPTPRGVATLSSLLAASPRALVHAVNNSAASGLLDVRAATRLGLFLFRDLRAGETVDDDELRLLWSTAPVVACRLDLVGSGGPERESRLLEALNWEPSLGSGVLVTGEPVDQRIAGRPGDQLVALCDAIDLVPRAVLDVDTLVVANFEWLIAASGGACDIEAFVAGWRRRTLLPQDLTDVMRRHLEKREPPAGTVHWARFPALTLSAALALTADPADHTAYDLLWEATVFAPKLVARDIVLATALQLDTSRYVP